MLDYLVGGSRGRRSYSCSRIDEANKTIMFNIFLIIWAYLLKVTIII